MSASLDPLPGDAGSCVWGPQPCLGVISPLPGVVPALHLSVRVPLLNSVCHQLKLSLSQLQGFSSGISSCPDRSWLMVLRVRLPDIPQMEWS